MTTINNYLIDDDPNDEVKIEERKKELIETGKFPNRRGRKSLGMKLMLEMKSEEQDLNEDSNGSHRINSNIRFNSKMSLREIDCLIFKMLAYPDEFLGQTGNFMYYKLINYGINLLKIKTLQQ